MSYEQNIKDLGACNADSVAGVKSYSLFNDLKHSHVCHPELPPCLGHDLFEWVASCDIALSISRLVNHEKQLN